MKFVIRYPRRAFDYMLANGESKDRVRKSVNGFVMATYCELLGRHATPEEIEEGLHQWKGDAAWAPDLPPAGFEGPLRPPSVEPPVNGGIDDGQDILANGIISSGHAIPSPGGRVSSDPGTSWGDTDWEARLDLRMRMRASEEFVRTNLSRMIARFVNPSLSVPLSDLAGMGQQEVTSLMLEYLHAYRTAIALDERRWELERVYDFKHQIAFGKFLYQDLARKKGDPISKLSHDDRAVCASFFPWYMTFGGNYTPGYGEFDVWTSHIDIGQGIIYAPSPGSPCEGGGPWDDEVPGNLYPVWQLEKQKARDWLTQSFRDAVSAGIDILFFSSWQRPGIYMYPWLPWSGDRPWWDPNARGDGCPKEYLRFAVSVLNEMKSRGERTPKIACGVDTNVLLITGPFIDGGHDVKYQNLDPLAYAACLYSHWQKGWTAHWSDLESDPDNLTLHLDFPETHRYIASLVREFFEEVPLEHTAFIQGRPVCSLWTEKTAVPEHPDEMVKGINRFFCAEFYGRPIWWVAHKNWSGDLYDPLMNYFVHMAPPDPYDEAAELEERSFEVPEEPPPGPAPPARIRIGDVYTLDGKASASCKPWGGGDTCLTMFSVYPGHDMTHKWWFLKKPGGNEFTKYIADREFGLRYFKHWWYAFVDALTNEEEGLRPPIPPDINGNAPVPPPLTDWSHVRRIWIDTWNERYEGASIARSRESGDAYLVMTKVMSRIWRSGQYSTDPEKIVPVLLEAFTGSSVWDVRFGPRPAFEDYCRKHGVLAMVRDVLSNTQPARLRHSPQVHITRTPDPVTPLPVVREVSAEMTGRKQYLPVSISITGTGFNLHQVTGKVWIKLWPSNKNEASAGWRVFQDWKEDNPAHCRLIRVVQAPYGEEGIVLGPNEDYDRQKLWDGDFPLLKLLVPVYGQTSLKVLNIDMDTLKSAGCNSTVVILHVGRGYYYGGRYYHLQPGWRSFNLEEETLEEPRA